MVVLSVAAEVAVVVVVVVVVTVMAAVVVIGAEAEVDLGSIEVQFFVIFAVVLSVVAIINQVVGLEHLYLMFFRRIFPELVRVVEFEARETEHWVDLLQVLE